MASMRSLPYEPEFTVIWLLRNPSSTALLRDLSCNWNAMCKGDPTPSAELKLHVVRTLPEPEFAVIWPLCDPSSMLDLLPEPEFAVIWLLRDTPSTSSLPCEPEFTVWLLHDTPCRRNLPREP